MLECYCRSMLSNREPGHNILVNRGLINLYSKSVDLFSVMCIEKKIGSLYELTDTVFMKTGENC